MINRVKLIIGEEICHIGLTGMVSAAVRFPH